MAKKGIKANYSVIVMPQITLLFSQVLFLTVLVAGFSLILGASFIAYERTLSPIYTEELVTSLYD